MTDPEKIAEAFEVLAEVCEENEMTLDTEHALEIAFRLAQMREMLQERINGANSA